MENALGLKSSGDGERLSPAGDIEGGSWSSDRPWDCNSVVEEDNGDRDCFLTLRPAMEELGDASSGFAILRPPRAWERFRSPFMVDSLL